MYEIAEKSCCLVISFVFTITSNPAVTAAVAPLTESSIAKQCPGA